MHYYVLGLGTEDGVVLGRYDGPLQREEMGTIDGIVLGLDDEPLERRYTMGDKMEMYFDILMDGS